MQNFEELYLQIQLEQEELDERKKSARKEAISFVQNIVSQFNIQANEIQFGEAVATVKKTRKPTPAKYRLPNGEEWTGRGIMKKEFKQYLDANGLTKEDLDKFLIA